MKVLLVTSADPAYRHYYQAYTNLPNGILYIASFLEHNGHEVQVYDGYVDEREPKDFVSFAPDIIGFSVITGPNLQGSLVQSRQTTWLCGLGPSTHASAINRIASTDGSVR